MAMNLGKKVMESIFSSMKKTASGQAEGSELILAMLLQGIAWDRLLDSYPVLTQSATMKEQTLKACRSGICKRKTKIAAPR